MKTLEIFLWYHAGCSGTDLANLYRKVVIEGSIPLQPCGTRKCFQADCNKVLRNTGSWDILEMLLMNKIFTFAKNKLHLFETKLNIIVLREPWSNFLKEKGELECSHTYAFVASSHSRG